MSRITVREAAKLTGKSRETINNATKNGTLSYTKNERGTKVIDIAELERVYELVKTFDELENEDNVKNSQPPSETDSQGWRERYLEMKAKFEKEELRNQLLEKERERERADFSARIEPIESALDKALDLTKAIEHRPSQDQIVEDAKRAAQIEIEKMKGEAKKKEVQIQKLLEAEEKRQKRIEERRREKEQEEAERQKSFLKKLFS